MKHEIYGEVETYDGMQAVEKLKKDKSAYTCAHCGNAVPNTDRVRGMDSANEKALWAHFAVCREAIEEGIPSLEEKLAAA